uniref:PKD domain-containing protein n=1 Tax=Algoriphagus sp. TaxID=1872435 RepID=UPI0025CB818A
MQPLQSYPVFEADQVLSNGHLNNLLNYLEQQERLTRIKLLGRGIVCGLEITSSPSEIIIGKGCGITSQGYLIQLCDTNYTFFSNYTPPTLPNDLTFLTQCSTENRNNVPFYNQKDILELIPSNDKETEGKKPLTTLKLEDYAIVLFLEAEQIDLKNCDTQDCNDKGSKMDFELRALLIHKKLLESSKSIGFNSLLLKRYNVPVVDLKTSEDVLQGFLNITDDVTLSNMSENLVRCWDRFAVSLGLPEENPLKGLNLIDFKKKFSTKTGQQIYLQYFYDFIDDLFKAYLEFRSKVREAYGECCPEEMSFPLHLILGMANESTLLGNNNIHRHYFESSPILNGQSKIVEEAASLLEKLVAMVKSFVGEKLSANESIIITPNYLGSEAISLRCIPYYYDWKTINTKWYFNRRYNGNERYNLGYRAAKQVDAPEPVKNPLLYDIERYNAFRIEGHVGKNYRTALTDIIQQKNKFNLPFDVLALNALDLSKILNGKEIKCHVEDLSSDYRVMITGIVCQLQQIMAYVGNLRPKRTVESNLNLGTLAVKRDFYISRNLVDMQKTIKSDLLKNQPLSISNEDIIKNLALRDVEEGEKLADFVAKDVGSFIVDHKAFFDYIIKQPDLLLIFLQQLAEIVKYLLAYDLDKFDEEAYNKLWTPYSKTVASLITEASNSDNEEIKRYFSSSNTELLFKCSNEKLFALKDEYLKRIEEYHAAINFSEYFKKHPGLEHKAGVPKGGTFILVYNGVSERVLPSFNTNIDREFIAGLSLASSTPNEATSDPFGLRASIKPEEISRTNSLIGSKSINKTEFEIASSLIERLNLGEASKNVLEALKLKDKEIREQASPIAKGTVIADFYLPYLCCSECPPIAYVIPEVEEPENIGPIANAGEDQTFTLAPNQPISATLDGSASKDEDGTITAFAWSQTSGPQVTLKSPNKAKTAVEILAAGT